MLVLNAVIVASGISFLLWFHEFYSFGVLDYFKEIKIYSGHVRDWLFYDHAAFISFFGLVGMLFAHRLFQNKELDRKFLFLYHIILLLCIILVGARIGLLIYMIFLMNLVLQCGGVRRLLINSLLFVVFSAMLVFNIHKIDQNRYHLWSVSWEAIREKPWFGHGLGASNGLLHDSLYIKRAGFSEALELNHSHNQFITFFLEIGLLGFIMTTLILGYFLYRTGHYKNTSLMLFLFGLGYIFLSESILETSKPLYIICFLFLILTSHSDLNVQGRHTICI
jgi:O-antigen ligase